MRLKDLTPQWLIETHFFGIYKRDIETGEPYLANPSNARDRFPNSILQQAIDEAIAYFESHLDVSVKYREQITERHDYDQDQHNEYMMLVLRKYPVTRIHSLKMQYGEQGGTIWDIPTDLIQMHGAQSKFGIINVLPRVGLSGYDPAYASLFSGLFYRDRAPSIYEVVYDAGIDGWTSDLDPLLARAIGLKAAIHPLNIFGDIVIGAGIASFSSSVDGVSQSINTTSSAENAAFSARIIMHRKELFGEQGSPGIVQDLEKQWRRPPLGLL